jgi:hypothetical protein
MKALARMIALAMTVGCGSKTPEPPAHPSAPLPIMQMIAGTNNAPAVKSADDIAATDAAHRQRISMFSPPTGTNRYLGVMIVQNGVEPVTIMMKTNIAP